MKVEDFCLQRDDDGIEYLKVIPLLLFYYQTFFETWRNEHS